MEFDLVAVQKATTVPTESREHWRQDWLKLMDLAVWGDLRSQQIGLAGKLRKRVLEFGERLRSYASDRSWIPHPREQIKNALSSSLQLREVMAKVGEVLGQFAEGTDLAGLQVFWEAFSGGLMMDITEREGALVALLNQQYQEEV
ncbi:hypothetical protein B1757_00365 [Acidithiobacillus marinus]|uniref:Uncharacterized protein n=1 Tax=Acidithiobacillus marinus TaxID=187490 RepID=A0A2I1DQS5_9PROT|nr:hypothetical protein [Acidithiobacillus marinus]PKY12234.1 hypothetical protein B1757_00365 [Acidithiobacillus marinus]